uniref:Peroxisomal membrane protein PEX13 n=1 Tax=Monopterus albus TaxID=43700 RepID=A0A3Q3IXD2_MONAL|nr:peroxisome biogenesis factor 13 [Monopterus albus]
MHSQPPPKPWERRIPGVVSAPVNYRHADFAPTPGSSTTASPPVLTRMAPPVPPRPVHQSYRPSYNSFTSSFGPYGNSFYGGYSPYSYGGYGLGRYNSVSHLEDVAPSRFVQQAEENSHGAFQSIESIVQAFASVSMMLDATFSAVYNSFRAVLDVANHLTRLRAHLTRVFSAFALVRTLRYLYQRLQRLLGQRSNAEVEDLWADSASDALATSASRGYGAGVEYPTSKSWPIFLFFAVVLGGPYFIWKLLNSSTDSGENATNWANGEDDHVVARAEYDFTAASEEEISLRAGDMLNLAPKEQQPRMRGWLLASLDGQTTGLVPANYVKVLGKRRGQKHAEIGRVAQVQQGSTEEYQTALAAQPQPHPAQDFTPGLGSAPTSDSAEMLESVYREIPASFSLRASNSTMPSSVVLSIPEKTDL